MSAYILFSKLSYCATLLSIHKVKTFTSLIFQINNTKMAIRSIANKNGNKNYYSTETSSGYLNIYIVFNCLTWAFKAYFIFGSNSYHCLGQYL